ncbi:MAG: beta-galactosidase [Victivallales bacterium]|nr:beta-galactosidase [Victivallales bacterium]
MTYKAKQEFHIKGDNPGNGKSCLYLRGGISSSSRIDYTAGIRFIRMDALGRRGVEGALATLHVMLYGEAARFLGTISKAKLLPGEWAAFSLEVEVPETYKGGKVEKIMLGFGSDQGAFLDDIRFSANETLTLKEPAPLKPKAFGEAEDFLALKPFSAQWQKQLREGSWETDNAGLPPGWMPLFYFKKGALRLVKDAPEKGRNAYFIRGDVGLAHQMVDGMVTNEVIVKFKARSNTPGATAFARMNYGGLGVNPETVQFQLTPEWKEYTGELRYPRKVKGKVCRMLPSIGSTLGAEFTDVVFSAKQKKALPQEAPQGKLLLDFDFSGIGGKREYADSTGNYRIFSDCGDFKVEHDALRVAFGSRFRIPCASSAFGESFSISIWLLKSGLAWGYRSPILNKGYFQGYSDPPVPRNKFDFAISVNSFIPEFIVHGTRGLGSVGHFYNNDYRYADAKCQVSRNLRLLKRGEWTHLAATYDNGEMRLYVNGVKLAEKKIKVDAPMMRTDLPLYLGGMRVEGENDNQFSAEMLVRTLKVRQGAMNEREVAYEACNPPKGIILEERIELQETDAYFSDEFRAGDPDFKTQPPIVKEYLDNPPKFDKQEEKMLARQVLDKGRVSLELNKKKYGKILIEQSTGGQKGSYLALDFAACGAQLYRIGRGNPDVFWPEPGKLNLEPHYFEGMRRILAVRPDAKFLIVIPVTPPKWFMEQYPEELEEYYMSAKHPELGKKKWKGFGGPFASEIWTAMAEKLVFDFISAIESSPYGKYVFDYNINAGDAGEWYWPGIFAGAPGYSKRTREAFQKFLKAKYKTVEKLRQAWNDDSITFESADVPDIRTRYNTENFLFRDEKKAKNCIDYRIFVNECTYDSMRRFGTAAKKAAPNKLISTYYGYSLYYSSRNNHLMFDGHQMVGDVLENNFFDGIASPLDYIRRRGGEAGVNICAYTGTALLNNKLLWREEDLRTHLHKRLEYGRIATAADTAEVVRRDAAYAIAGNFAMWLCIAMEGVHHGFHQQSSLEAVRDALRIANQAELEMPASNAEVALVFDEKDSLYSLAAKSTPRVEGEFVMEHTWGTWCKAHRMGAPFELHLLPDLGNPKMPDYKLYIFMNAWNISEAQQKMIQDKLSRNHAVAVWLYAPGYIRNGAFDLSAMKSLTGFDFTEERREMTLGKSKPAVASSIITAGFAGFGEYRLGPVFNLKPGTHETLVSEGKQVLMASKDNGAFRSVWCILPPTASLLTGLCDYAGVHVYSRSGDVFIANSKYAMLHTSGNAPREISFPKSGNVTELYRNVDYGKKSRIQVKPDLLNQTFLFRYGVN